MNVHFSQNLFSQIENQKKAQFIEIVIDIVSYGGLNIYRRKCSITRTNKNLLHKTIRTGKRISWSNFFFLLDSGLKNV